MPPLKQVRRPPKPAPVRRAPRPAAPQGRPPAPRPTPKPAGDRKRPPKLPLGHRPREGTRPPTRARIADADQSNNQRIFVRVGEQLAAPKLAIMAALCAGSGENNWHTEGCNSLHACGVWQLMPSWQSMHDYHDVTYWTNYAYKNGFWHYGGLINMARQNPNASPGMLANMCQGAFSDLNQGARYYDQYISEATSIYNANAGSVGGGYGGIGQGAGGTITGYVSPFVHATVSATRVDQGCDYAGTGTIGAIGAARVVNVQRNDPGWLGAFIEYVLTAPGPLGSHSVYVAEHITPSVNVGDLLNPGDPIATFIPGGGIEMGWGAQSPSQYTWQRVYGGGWTSAQDGADYASRAGISFNDVIVAIGGPRCSINGPVFGNWPSWTPNGQIPTLQRAGSGGGVPAGNPGGGGVPNFPPDYRWMVDYQLAWHWCDAGAKVGSHHSHAAWFEARGKQYLTAPP